MKITIESLSQMKTKHRKVILLLADIFLISICYLSTWIMINGRISLTDYLPTLLMSWGIYVFVSILVFWRFGMYESLWRYAEAYEYSKSLVATILSSLIFTAVTLLVLRPPLVDRRVPFSIYFLSAMLGGMSTLMLRMFYRAIRTSSAGRKLRSTTRRVMIIGAGETGNAVLHDILRDPARKYEVVCMVDDDTDKVGRRVQRVKVEGTTADIPRLVDRYHIDIIILATPSITKDNLKRVSSICAKTKCQLKKVPNLFSLVDNSASVLSMIRDVSIEDLLGRDVVDVREGHVSTLTGRTVLVTGAGGSIGSELCRQIMTQEPRQLIMVDISENGLYAIEQELLRVHGHACPIVAEIATVREFDKLDKLFARYKPEYVYHAAAHKHVPLMETAPEEAVKNNIFGTINIAKAADKHGVRKFTMISTDKAVNPTNVMGATKRVCEMVIQCMNQKSHTEYVAVRFGNVLGSNGSVIPLFRDQIAAGGPVTVTDPEIIRYFMTISEAVSLVLTAGEMASGGEIFVLDMGSPVKIVDLAENLIRMSGYEPYTEIEIQYTGLRPGEKLYEELLLDEEGIGKTENEKIFVCKPRAFLQDDLWNNLKILWAAVEQNNTEAAIAHLHTIVPEFSSSNGASV